MSSQILAAPDVRESNADAAQWRDALSIIGVLAPILLLTGTAKDAHEVAWQVWYLGLRGLVVSISSAALAIWLPSGRRALLLLAAPALSAAGATAVFAASAGVRQFLVEHQSITTLVFYLIPLLLAGAGYLIGRTLRSR